MNHEKNINEAQEKDTKMTLDDANRVKVLSPSRLVLKRFLRNKLAIVGLCVLIALFVFCFLGPLFYPYGETEIFYGWREQNNDYAYSQFRTEFVSFWNPECDTDLQKSLSLVERNVNSTIKKMDAAENPEDALRYKIQSDDGVYYDLVKLDDKVYALTDSTYVCVADYVKIGKGGKVIFKEGYTDLGLQFTNAATAAIDNGGSFEF